MSDAPLPEAQGLDLSACAREPIHVPGSIQPHGVLMCIDEAAEPGAILQVSESVQDQMGVALDAALGAQLASVIGAKAANRLAAKIADAPLERSPAFLDTIEVNGRAFHALAHRHAGSLVLEFERAATRETDVLGQVYPLLRDFLTKLHAAPSVADAADIATREIRQITGFDRVLVYRFDANWNGHVIAEQRDESLPPYLDLWFPASDIPPQARELYRLNRSRLIADTDYRPSPILPAANPRTGQSLDLTYSTLRSVSPVHIEYLHNMGVAASMSFSIVSEGQLWGLISCHHRTARTAPYGIRVACDFAAQALSAAVLAREQQGEYKHRIAIKSIMTRLLAHMANEDQFVTGLKHHPEDLLAFADAAGAAILWEDSCTLMGSTPSEDQVLELTDWLVQRGREDVFHTDCLGLEAPLAESVAELASGVLAISISKLYRSHILWFRPEVVRTVTWGGDPRKPAEPETGTDRLHPRKSFDWKELVRGRSAPWRNSEIETAVEFRNAIVGIVLRKAEELGELSAELQRSNQELEAFSYSVSHDLRAPFRHIVGYSEMLRDRMQGKLDETSARYIETVIDSAQFAGTLVDKLLNFSRIGRSRLTIADVNMKRLVDEVIHDLDMEARGRTIEWRIGPLPVVKGDLMMLRTSWQNLLSNALKYTRGRERAVIEIAGEESAAEWIFSVRDNGVGFDPRYVDKLFGIFQRLHRMEDYEGTGIGLANVRRIAARHGGRTWADGVPGQGAVFFFTISKRLPERTA